MDAWPFATWINVHHSLAEDQEEAPKRQIINRSLIEEVC